MSETSGRTGGIQVIARAASILRLLGDHPGGLSLGGIAGRVGLARSTVQRIVQALEVEGFVEPSGPGGGFQLGPTLSELVYRRQIDIVTEARPFLEEISAELGETVALCAMTGRSVVTIDRCIAERPLRVVFPLGTIPHPAYLLAPGRAILAELPRDRAARILAESLPEADVAQELERLDRDRPRARDKGCFIADLSGFAVPLRTHLGLYSIAAILPTSRAGKTEEAVFSTLLAFRGELEKKIGAPSGDPPSKRT